jgi:hypothetical protein
MRNEDIRRQLRAVKIVEETEENTKMVAVRSYETSVKFHLRTQCHIPEDSDLHSCRR